VPPRGGLLSEEDEEAERRSWDELRSAEQKLRGLKDRRSEMLDVVHRLAEEALDLQARRRSLYDDAEGLHQSFRDLGHAQTQLRVEREKIRGRISEILGSLKQSREEHPRDKRIRPEQITREIALLEKKQQTSVLTVKEENALIDHMRQLRAQLTEAQKSEAVWKAKDESSQGLKDELDQMRKRMDEVQAKIEELRKQRDETMAKIKAQLAEGGHLIAAIREKGKARSELLAKVSEISKTCDEMERSVMGLRQQSFQRRDEARKALQDHNRTIRHSLRGEDVLARSAEENLQMLLKKGKVELRG
jgi:uncharacterized coiled-coil DUF342 family protein